MQAHADAGEILPAWERRPDLTVRQMLLQAAYHRASRSRPLGDEKSAAPIPCSESIAVFWFLDLWELIDEADWLDLVSMCDTVIHEHFQARAPAN